MPSLGLRSKKSIFRCLKVTLMNTGRLTTLLLSLGLSVFSVSVPLLYDTPASAQEDALEDELTQDNILGDYSADNLPTLSLGSEGSVVRQVQLFLRRRGFYEGPIDGEYEFETRSAVREFQRTNDLVDDGIIGPQTWQAMTNAGEG